jgi:hypothetical protein
MWGLPSGGVKMKSTGITALMMAVSFLLGKRFRVLSTKCRGCKRTTEIIYIID